MRPLLQDQCIRMVLCVLNYLDNNPPCIRQSEPFRMASVRQCLHTFNYLLNSA